MKLEIALCLVLCTGYAFCVNCTTNQNCADDTRHGCSGGWFEICQHPNPAGGITTDGGLCTCGPGTACTNKDECRAYSCPNNRNIHCYDSKCICSRF